MPTMMKQQGRACDDGEDRVRCQSRLRIVLGLLLGKEAGCSALVAVQNRMGNGGKKSAKSVETMKKSQKSCRFYAKNLEDSLKDSTFVA